MVSVSVVIPTYRHRRFVMQTLDAVFAQTYGDYEVIVINDGSPDDTAELLRPLIESGRIRYVEQSNQGQGAARNRGIEMARGRYIALLDDDDLWPADKLAWQVAAMEADPGLTLVYGSWHPMNEAGEKLPHNVEDFPSGEVLHKFLEGCWILSPGQTLIRRNVLQQVRGFDETIRNSDDWDLYIRLAQAGRFLYRRDPALLYRFHAGNASRNAIFHVQNHLRVMRKHRRLYTPALALRHFRAAAPFFVPNLMRCAERLRGEGRYADALRAHLYVLLFQLRIVTTRWWLAAMVNCLIRRPPRQCAID